MRANTVCFLMVIYCSKSSQTFVALRYNRPVDQSDLLIFTSNNIVTAAVVINNHHESHNLWNVHF